MAEAERVVRGILFDSGDTLIRPVGGAWFPPPAFRAVLAANGLAMPPNAVLERALEAGMRYLDAHHHLASEEEERRQFEEYHAIVLAALGPPYDDRRLAREIVAAPERGLSVEPFPETRAVLEDLRARGLRLGIVSNAWPSLDRIYRALGLRHFFDAFVVSARVGCLKPDPRIFEVAVDEIGLPAADLLFVDDWAENVRAANAVGLAGVLIARDGQKPTEDLAWIADLTALRSLV